MKGVEKEATITVIKVYFLSEGSWFILLPPAAVIGKMLKPLR